MTETIPADIMEAARATAAVWYHEEWEPDNDMCRALVFDIARAIMAHTARQDERIKELEEALEAAWADASLYKSIGALATQFRLSDDVMVVSRGLNMWAVLNGSIILNENDRLDFAEAMTRACALLEQK